VSRRRSAIYGTRVAGSQAFMWSLIAAELGGFVVLFYGAGIGLSFW
jgi:hypothetical protein